MNEDKASRYHRLKRRAHVASLGWSVLLLALLIGSGASWVLRDLAESLAHGLRVPPPLITASAAALYAAVLVLLNELGAAPLELFSGFVLERRYGLSTETAGHWLKDRVKALSIGSLVAACALAFMYAAIEWSPQRWWIAAAIGLFAFAVLLAKLGPVLLLPLFFRFTPLDREPLRQRLMALAARAGTRVVGAYEWRVSDRTRKVNAALTGLGATRRVLVSDTLLSGEYSDDEIEVILAHELGHHVHGDIWKGILFEAVLGLVGLYTAHRLLTAAGPAFGLRGLSDPAGVPLLLIVMGVLSRLLVPIENALSRANERRADRFALELTSNPGAFVTAMRRLGSHNLAEENPSWAVRMLFYTHPPVRERIAAAQEWKDRYFFRTTSSPFIARQPSSISRLQ